ncbi:hypothetical protein L3X38_023735 [Prunus dulcis]|uniref:Integrase zinc-binding domain-containing protein n=1 Tax=Prunus dulcis TaxID=3755 RepID=A0AAD4VYK8_PRUDU|nr:hypothetical protein L3X38_023735 [Prunus dulcis]
MEFAYNNSYHSSIEMAQYEALSALGPPLCPHDFISGSSRATSQWVTHPGIALALNSFNFGVPTTPKPKRNYGGSSLFHVLYASRFTKMYRTLREHYSWPHMKGDIAKFVSRCLICQQVKAEWQKLSGLMQPLPIPEWKWEHITMDFVFKLPRTSKGHDGI